MGTTEKAKWNIDSTHSEINFKVKHMMISTVTGGFGKFDASVEAADDSFKDASFKFEAEIDSINTNNKDRDAHLKSDDFFNAEQFPKLTFESTSFDGDKMTGNLTIRDVTKEVTLDVDFNGVAVDPYGQTKAGFDRETKINKKDLNQTGSAVTEAESIVVSEKVKLIAT